MAAVSCLRGARNKRCRGKVLWDYGEAMSQVSWGCLSPWLRHFPAWAIVGRCLSKPAPECCFSTAHGSCQGLLLLGIQPHLLLLGHLHGDVSAL